MVDGQHEKHARQRSLRWARVLLTLQRGAMSEAHTDDHPDDHAADHMPIVGSRTGTTWRLVRLAACCLGAAVLWACGPVYIPVPPPMQTTFSLDTITDSSGKTSQVWIAAGGPEPRASDGIYYILDEPRKAGVIAGALPDGSYQAPPMPGTTGDHILINYKDVGGKLSPTACLILGEERPTALPCP